MVLSLVSFHARPIFVKSHRPKDLLDLYPIENHNQKIQLHKIDTPFFSIP